MSNKREKKKLSNRREILKGLLAQCTYKQREVFEKMYGSIDKMSHTKLPWATKQCEKTILINSPEYKLQKELDKFSEGCGCLQCLNEREDYKVYNMILCTKCGNKRCPHATDHRNECTNSNMAGQKGSMYE